LNNSEANSAIGGEPVQAILALADGSVYYGEAFGHRGVATGEVVFNTSMSGYQEILSDPSYAQQMVTLTYPHIGNVGTNKVDMESKRTFCTALIIKAYPKQTSNYRSTDTLDAFMNQQKVVGIHSLDVRKLTRAIRTNGAQNAVLVSDGSLTVDEAVAKAKGLPSMNGQDLAKVVSTEAAYVWNEGSYDVVKQRFSQPPAKYKVVAYDFGIKTNILRLLADRGCEVTVVPAQTPAADVLAMSPDGVFLSNGPGDPEPCDYAISATQAILASGTPVFGICLGHQILALASGAKTEKMKCGHHGANHPVKDLQTGTVAITSQNHGFHVAETEMPANMQITHRSLFDQTIQGVERTDCAAFGFQGHPEASPGPKDIQVLFDKFIDMISAAKAA
jgi:carbamoyl-phosphate synthase small subunit